MNCQKSCKQLVLLALFLLIVLPCKAFSQAYEQSDEYVEYTDEEIESGTRICPLIEGSLFHNDYYVGGISVGVDFLFVGVLNPFYFGVGARGNLGFANDPFPFTYKVNDNELGAPMLVGGSLYVPFGICFSPFINENIKLFIAAKGGVNLVTLLTIGTNASSNVHFLPMGSVGIGLLIYGFELEIHTEYDTLNQFSQGVRISYRIPLMFGGKKYE